MKDTFTHYDLHWNNLHVYEPAPGKYIQYHYHLVNDMPPVSFKSKSCTSEYGCNEISNGDTVYVDGLNATFQVTMYDNATMRYLPFV